MQLESARDDGSAPIFVPFLGQTSAMQSLGIVDTVAHAFLFIDFVESVILKRRVDFTSLPLVLLQGTMNWRISQMIWPDEWEATIVGGPDRPCPRQFLFALYQSG